MIPGAYLAPACSISSWAKGGESDKCLPSIEFIFAAGLRTICLAVWMG